MKDKEAIVVLQDMLKKYPRTSKEASAIRLAMWVLA
jgi:hypothetical protein